MNQELADRLQEEVNKLNPSPVIELFELDTRPCGEDGDVLYFHNGTGGFSVPISFMGISYTPMPISVKGFELNSTGEPPRPTLSMLNAGGFLSMAVLKMDDLIGALFTRRRTFARFLDGEPEAKPVQYPPDVFTIVQKTREDRLLVEFELGSGLDLDGVRFPTRTVVATYCQHIYRGVGCRFSGEYVVAGINNSPATGILKFRGPWENNLRYSKDETVQFNSGGDLGIYVCIIAPNTVITGDASSPLDSSKWTRIQRYRGEFSATTGNYVENDVVYITAKTGRQFYKAVRAVPLNIKPPNKIYWMFDECGRSVNHCRWRFDPMKLNRYPLPFGAFPGTMSIPDVS